MTAEEIIRGAAEQITREVIALVERVAAERAGVGALVVADFARAVDRHPEVVRRAIRARIIPQDMVSPRPPYRLQPAALACFGVTAEQAAARRRLPPPAPRWGARAPSRRRRPE